MKIDAVGVASSDLAQTVSFYKILGFEFPELKPDDSHIEAKRRDESARLMIDSKDLIKEITGTTPVPSNHSQFAIEFENAKEIDTIAENLKINGFKVFKEPWDAFWGQRYCIVQDPDGYMIDLFSVL